jgi:hypothetical protein
MSDIQTSQLVKIIIGAFVVVVVLIGVFFFFKDTVIDFFKNTFGGEEDKEIPPDEQEVKEPSAFEQKEAEKICKECRGLRSVQRVKCTLEECGALNLDAMKFGMNCKFEDKFWNKCVAVIPS